MFFLFSLVIKFVFLLFMSFCSHGILALDLLLLLLVLIGVFFLWRIISVSSLNLEEIAVKVWYLQIYNTLRK